MYDIHFRVILYGNAQYMHANTGEKKTYGAKRTHYYVHGECRTKWTHYVHGKFFVFSVLRVGYIYGNFFLMSAVIFF